MKYRKNKTYSNKDNIDSLGERLIMEHPLLVMTLFLISWLGVIYLGFLLSGVRVS